MKRSRLKSNQKPQGTNILAEAVNGPSYQGYSSSCESNDPSSDGVDIIGFNGTSDSFEAYGENESNCRQVVEDTLATMCKIKLSWPKPYFNCSRSFEFEMQWSVTVKDIFHFMRHDLKQYHSTEGFPASWVESGTGIKWRLVMKQDENGHHKTLNDSSTLQQIYSNALSSPSNGMLHLDVRPPKEWLLLHL